MRFQPIGEMHLAGSLLWQWPFLFQLHSGVKSPESSHQALCQAVGMISIHRKSYKGSDGSWYRWGDWVRKKLQMDSTSDTQPDANGCLAHAYVLMTSHVALNGNKPHFLIWGMNTNLLKSQELVTLLSQSLLGSESLPSFTWLLGAANRGCHTQEEKVPFLPATFLFLNGRTPHPCRTLEPCRADIPHTQSCGFGLVPLPL